MHWKALAMGLLAGIAARMVVMVVVNLFAIQHYGLTPAQALQYATTTALLFNLIQGAGTALLVLMISPILARAARAAQILKAVN